MRPATFEPQEIIEAGLALQAEGKNITGFALRNRTGGGNPTRLKQLWDEYQSKQIDVTTEPMAELPIEVADAVQAISSALTERLVQLATELHDKIIKVAERRVDDITRMAEEQQRETEQEMADAAQTVDTLEQKLEGVTADLRKTLELLDNSREQEQAHLIELAQVRERLAATEERLKASEKSAKTAAEQYQQQLVSEQERLRITEEKLTETTIHHEAELKTQYTALDKALREVATVRESKAQLNGELNSLKEQNYKLTALLAGKTKSPK